MAVKVVQISARGRTQVHAGRHTLYDETLGRVLCGVGKLKTNVTQFRHTLGLFWCFHVGSKKNLKKCGPSAPCIQKVATGKPAEETTVVYPGQLPRANR